MGPSAKHSADKLVFEMTRWDLIWMAKDGDSAEHGRRQAARALNQLCEMYRAPVLAYLERCTGTPHDAEDLAQEFFAHRIGPELFANATAQKGRFRTLLLVCLKNFVRDYLARERTAKRGGRIKFVGLDETADAYTEAAMADDRFFDVCWAKTVIDRAVAQMRREFSERGGDTRRFDFLVPFLTRPAAGPELAEAAGQLAINVNALHARVSRLRVLFVKCVRDELARTVAAPDEIEPEVRYLLDVLAAAS